MNGIGVVKASVLVGATTVVAMIASSAVATAAPPPAPGPRDTTIGVGPGAANFVDAFVQTLPSPALAPVGSNDWTCKPDVRHPRPVVLVHGTWENAYDNWSALSPALKADGYCVFAPNLGRSDLLNKGGVISVLPNTNGTKPIESSADELAAVVAEVRAATGAQKVDLVGHSQGGLIARQFLKFNGGNSLVDNVVTLAATHHGTTLSGIGNLDRWIGALGLNLDPALDHIVGQSGIQQVYDSPFLRTLNADGDTMPGVHYTAVATAYDEVSTPFDATFLQAGPEATVDNVLLQDGCPVDHSEHISMSYSPRVIDLTRRALASEAAEPPPLRCTPNAPLTGAGTTGSTEVLTGSLAGSSANNPPGTLSSGSGGTVVLPVPGS